MKKKKIALFAGIGAAAVIMIGAVVWSQQTSAEETDVVYKETTAERGTLTVGVTESGSVEIGTIEQEFELEESSTSSSGSSSASASGMGAGMAGQSSSSGTSSSADLEVEEVYVSVGQQVSEGDALLKLTAESVAEYREVLSDAVESASASVTEAQLSAQQQKLEAEYSKSISVAKGSVAEENYNATMKELSDAVEEAQQKVDDSAGMIGYYQAQISAGIDASDALAKEQENYEMLCTKLKAAQNNYTTKSIEAEKTYQSAMLSSSNANSQYQVDITGADSAVKTAQETLEEAKEALANFDAVIGDGVVYAEYSGTVMEVGYAAGDTFSTDTTVVTFADADSVTMTVSVSQEDIADIAVGDAVSIALTAYEDVDFEGVVSSMDTSVSSGSSTVSYDVTVVFTGEIDGVYQDMTGNVTFIEKQMKDVIYVSNKAIQNEGTTSYVKVKDADGTIHRVTVETGFSDGVNVEIKSGISEGDTVLIEGKVTAE